MAIFEWEALMTQWNQDILGSTAFQDMRHLIPAEQLQAKWLGYPGASEAQIFQAEQRLGMALPPSYTAFLRFSNGWTMLSTFIGNLWSTDQVNWLRMHNPQFINTILKYGEQDIPDSTYFIYGKGQDRDSIRTRYLHTALAISDSRFLDGDFLLLNPEVRTADGEWEAWRFCSDEYRRHRSFWDLMRAEYESFLKIKDS